MVDTPNGIDNKQFVDPVQLFSALASLPDLYDARQLPALFEDSTHQLWRCETSEGLMMLKICQQAKLVSSFWQITEQLFGRYLPRDLGCIDVTQKIIEQHGRIPLPELVSWGQDSMTSPAFVLTRFIEGSRLQSTDLNEAIIEQLAEHLAALHQLEYSHWGNLSQVQREADTWPQALRQTLLNHSKKYNINKNWLSQALTQLQQLNHTSFSPIMLDNRLDQYLYEDDYITALVDLDAFVAGPRELELVLLEYQLDKSQAALFSETYQQSLPMPDLSPVRLSYRLLLFLMNALGATDLNQWMQAPTRFRTQT